VSTCSSHRRARARTGLGDDGLAACNTRDGLGTSMHGRSSRCASGRETIPVKITSPFSLLSPAACFFEEFEAALLVRGDPADPEADGADASSSYSANLCPQAQDEPNFDCV
jgi:hypothetical protein